ncbi:hypothetical protein CTAYLR_002619 [Chrysophaeum taylorii]|uniref:Spindle assembly checkpoint component MAD1 n=1 Tax=Chrysophaeum taylorii TaxID=2483200 RepID=A0AAD7UFP6_9STRA|nr:hypothetical protein CTAYLR_002619 [Chrysophaeum taylorii]
MKRGRCEEEEEKTVRLECDLAGLLATFDEKEKLRSAESAWRESDRERLKLEHEQRWLLDELEEARKARKAEVVVYKERVVEDTTSEKLLEARREIAELRKERALTVARHARELEGARRGVREEEEKIVPSVSKEEKYAAEICGLKAKVAELEAALKRKKPSAVAEERIRALEKVIERHVGTDDAAIECERLRQEQKEWHAHFCGGGEKTPAAAFLKVKGLREDLSKEKDRSRNLERLVEEKKREADAYERKLDAVEAVLGKAKVVEREAELNRLEVEALKRLVLSTDDVDHSTYLRDLETTLAKERALLSPPPPQEEEEEEECRVVHLIKNPTKNRGMRDETKLNERLKERFREHLAWFREAVYLLLGFKIDMTTTKDGPHVRLRSMFAESPQDALLFQWTDDGVVQLLSTPFASRLDERLFASLQLCNSVPAFLANVQLSLWESTTKVS